MSWLPDVTYWGNEWQDEWLDPGPPALYGWVPDRPARRLPPRCGRVLVLDGRYERGGEPGDPGDPPVCGRPAGHPPAANGSPGCRSEASVARNWRADLDRQRVRRSKGADAESPASIHVTAGEEKPDVQ